MSLVLILEKYLYLDISKLILCKNFTFILIASYCKQLLCKISTEGRQKRYDNNA